MSKPSDIGEQLAAIVLKKLEEDRLTLPTLPEVTQKARSMLSDPNVHLPAVSRIIARDPLLAASLLKLANSAAYSSGERVTTLDAAVNRLGVTKMNTALIEAHARAIFSSRDPGIARTFGVVLDHSLVVAYLARDLAGLVDDVDAELTYLAGLLHDIGKPVLGAMLLEAERIAGAAGERGKWINSESWRNVIATHHRKIGVAVGKSWSLPTEVLNAITEPNQFQDDDGQQPANVVRLANSLAKLWGHPSGPFVTDDVEALVALGTKMLGLDPSTVAGFEQKIAEYNSAKSLSPVG